MPKINLKVRMTVEVDEDRWREEFGALDVRDDAEAYLLSVITDSSAANADAITVTGYAVR